MTTILRLIMLAAFASAGVGLAVAFAKHTESHPLSARVVFAGAATPRPNVLKPSSGDLSEASPSAEHGKRVQSSTSPLPINPALSTKSADAPPRFARAQRPAVNSEFEGTPLSQQEATARIQPYAPLVGSQTKALERTLDLLEQTLKDRRETGSTQVPPPQAPQIEREKPIAPTSEGPRDRQAAPNAKASDNDQTVIRGDGDDRLEINLKDSDIREVLQLLSQQGRLNILASPNVTGTVSASLVGVTVPQALDAILKASGFSQRSDGEMIYVGTAEDLRKMGHTNERIGTRIYRPNYVRAEELQRLITPLLTDAVGQATVNSGAGVAGGAAGGNATSRLATTSPAARGVESNTTEAGGDDYAGGDVLLVRDYESVLQRVDEVVESIDRRPLQVSIEAMILSVRLDDSNERGVNFEILRDRSNTRLISGSPLGNLANINVADGGLKLGFLDQSLSAFVNALETVGDTNVVAAPRLLVMNKQRAEILIGSELGYVSTTVTESAATQAVEFLEVGTQLRIRPYISSDGMVRLEVHPELSTGSVRVEQGFTLPDKEVTQVTTNVLCPDASTVVIGGLIREDLVTTTSQIPLLGNLPIFGAAFRQKTEETDKREIIVLLTPRIMFNEQLCEEGSQGADRFLKRQSIYADKMSRLGKRHYGRRYLRLARAAWSAGDAGASLRYINLAIHFDPLNSDAIQLRELITAASNQGNRSVRTYLREGLAPWQHPSRDYSRSGYEWQDPPRYQPAIPADPAALIPERQPIETKREMIGKPEWIPIPANE